LLYILEVFFFSVGFPLKETGIKVAYSVEIRFGGPNIYKGPVKGLNIYKVRINDPNI